MFFTNANSEERIHLQLEQDDLSWMAKIALNVVSQFISCRNAALCALRGFLADLK